MKIAEFLDVLENRKLVSRTVVARLREKAADDPERLTPKAVLKYLVKKELIDRSAAVELLNTTITVSRAAESSILGSIPLRESETYPQSSTSLVTDEEIPTLTPIDSRQNLRMGQLDNQLAGSSSIFDDSQSVPTLSSSKISSLTSLSSKAREESAVEQLLREGQTVQPTLRKKATVKKKAKRDRNKSEWDSSLILYGGGGLLVLMLAGGIIYYLLNRENADFVLEQATTSFEGGSYTQAIAHYENFVTNFPNHPQHSEATVRLGTARLWQDVSRSGDFVQALATANAVLEDIENEPDFRSAQRDLAGLLPKIAQGLATQAEESTDPAVVDQRVAQTREALALCMNTKFVPKEFRDEVLLGAVEETLLRVERNQVQGVALAKALDEMATALESRDVGKAYAIRDTLLDDFPALIKDKSLADKVGEVSTVAGEVVQFVGESREAEGGDRPSAVVASLTLADRRASGSIDAPGIAAVRVGEALYGLQANDGSLLWRRQVGVDHKSNSVRLANGDVLVFDSAHNDLLRLEGATGKTMWRQPLPGPGLQPVVSGDVAYVAIPRGSVLVVELDSGKVVGEIRFGQGLAVPPTTDENSRRLYVLGEHSSLYTISTDDHSCVGVYYLGHASGSVAVPLVRVLNKVAVAINAGARSSHLRVLALNDAGSPESTDSIARMEGTVDTPLLSEGRRLAAITSLGEVSVFDVASSAGGDALNLIAKREAGKGPILARFSLLDGGNLWLADEQLSKLAVQATSKSIRLGNLHDDFAGATFNGPLQLIGDAVVHVRRPARGKGSVVAATNVSNGKTAWETAVAVPLAGPPVVDAERAQITAITSDGAAYVLDREALSRRVQDRANRPSSTKSSAGLDTTAALGKGVIVAGEMGANLALIFRPNDGSSPLKSVSLPSPMATELMPWRNGFVAATRVGQVLMLNASEGEPVATPFQPPLVADRQYEWLPAAAVGEGEDNRFVISDGQHAVYLVKYVADAHPYLEADTRVELSPTMLNTRFAVAGEVIAAGTAGGSLQMFRLPGLDSQPAIALGGQITWGPFATGNGFLLATDQGELILVTAGGEIGWRNPLQGKVPAGIPLVDGESAFIAWQLSGLSRLNLHDGTMPATTSLGQALVAGPVAYASRLVVATSDGTLLVVNRP